MATTGELRAIIEALELIDIGDAASYLGEEVHVVGELLIVDQSAAEFADLVAHSVNCGHNACSGT